MRSEWFMMIYDDLWWFMMIYDDLWWFMQRVILHDFAEVVVSEAIQSFTDVRPIHLSSSSSNANAWSMALCTHSRYWSVHRVHNWTRTWFPFCFGRFHWMSLVCRQHGQQQTLWFALKNHNGGSGTRFRGPKGGTVQKLQETSDFKGQDFVAWLRWEETESLGKSFADHDAECQTECKGSHNARKHVAMTHRGVLPAESVSCRSPLKVTGSQKPFKDWQILSTLSIKCHKHSWINLCCNHESEGRNSWLETT